jgi:hypothetical protein
MEIPPDGVEWETIYRFEQYGAMKLSYRSTGGNATLQIYRHWKQWPMAQVKLPDTQGEWRTIDLTLEDQYFGSCWIFELKGDAKWVDLGDLTYSGGKDVEVAKPVLPPTQIGITGVKPILNMTFEGTLNNQGTAKIAPIVRDFEAKPRDAKFVTCTGGGKALLLDGATYLDYGFSTELQPPSMTFACCIRILVDPLRPKSEPTAIWEGQQDLFCSKKYIEDPGVWIRSYGNRPISCIIGGKRTFKNQDNRDQNDVREVFAESNRTAIFAPDAWVHLAVTYDAASGNAAVYINGVKQTLKEDLHLIKIDKPTPREFLPKLETKNLIGTDKNSSKVTGISGGYFNCISQMAIDDLVLFPAAATEKEIATLYQASAPKIVIPAFDHITGVTPILSCKFDGNLDQGGSLKNRLAVRNKEMKETPAYFSDNGVHGKALCLRGDSYLDLGRSPMFEPRSVTYSAWIRYNNDMEEEQILLWTKDHFYDEGWYINSFNYRALMVSIGRDRGPDKGGTREVFVDRPRNEFFRKGEWTHVAVTYNHKTGEVAIYRNGKKMETRESSSSAFMKDLLKSSGFPKVIGVNGSDRSRYSKFDIDDLAIWPGSATQDEIKSLYNARFSSSSVFSR